MFLDPFLVVAMLFNAYYCSYVEYKTYTQQLTASLYKLNGVKPMSLVYIDQHPEHYAFNDSQLQALAALRRTVNKLNVDPNTVLINFGTGNLCATYNDKLIFINSAFSVRLPDQAQQEYILAHEFGHNFYKHSRSEKNLNIIVPMCLEMGLLIAYGFGATFLYPPKDKPTNGLKQFVIQLLVSNGAALVLAYLRSVSVFLLQRMLMRTHELQADAYAAKKLNNVQAGIAFFKSTASNDPKVLFKEYHKRPWRESLGFYWQEYCQHRKKYGSPQAFCLAFMPHLSCTHPDNAQRIKHLSRIKRA